MSQAFYKFSLSFKIKRRSKIQRFIKKPTIFCKKICNISIVIILYWTDCEMKCVIRWAEKAREYFCSLWDGQAIRVKPQDQPDIEEQHEDISERKRGSENDECARKRLRYRKMFVWRKWISRLLRLRALWKFLLILS